MVVPRKLVKYPKHLQIDWEKELIKNEKLYKTHHNSPFEVRLSKYISFISHFISKERIPSSIVKLEWRKEQEKLIPALQNQPQKKTTESTNLLKLQHKGTCKMLGIVHGKPIKVPKSRKWATKRASNRATKPITNCMRKIKLSRVGWRWRGRERKCQNAFQMRQQCASQNRQQYKSLKAQWMGCKIYHEAPDGSKANNFSKRFFQFIVAFLVISGIRDAKWDNILQ